MNIIQNTSIYVWTRGVICQQYYSAFATLIFRQTYLRVILLRDEQLNINCVGVSVFRLTRWITKLQATVADRIFLLWSAQSCVLYFLHAFACCLSMCISCYVIDQSGFVVYHRSFVPTPSDCSGITKRHLSCMAPDVALDMISRGVFTSQSCMSYVNVSRLKFWTVSLHLSTIANCLIVQKSNINANTSLEICNLCPWWWAIVHWNYFSHLLSFIENHLLHLFRAISTTAVRFASFFPKIMTQTLRFAL